MRVFLDANVLAAPLTRTLLLVAFERSGYSYAWSQRAEDETHRHLPPSAMPLEQLRRIYLDGMEVSVSAELAGRFERTRGGDRQILADAEVASSQFIVTNNVRDFHPEDLRDAGVSAVTPDLFMAQRVTPGGYRFVLDVVSGRQQRPPIAREELHRRLSAVHPRLFAAQNRGFGAVPLSPRHNPPAVEHRGTHCVQCAQVAPSGVVEEGLCEECRPR